MKKCISRFVKEDRGVTALEYALVAGLIAVALVTTIGSFNTGLSNAFGYIVTLLPHAASGA